jgi:plastocyanin
VNGCDQATATDMTGMATATITFPSGGLNYSPKCLRVSAGTMETFSGSFSSHPLEGGNDGTPDPSSPITSTSTGTSKTFTLSTPGAYGYYCTFHVASGMKGAIFVE